MGSTLTGLRRTYVADLANVGLDAVRQIGHAIILLGNAGALTAEGAEMGAIEAHGMALTEGLDGVAAGLNNVASALQEIATAIEQRP